jgi:hypothetical protein
VLSSTPAALCLGLALALASGPLRADDAYQKRIFSNTSTAPWTLEVVDRAKEVGQLRFVNLQDQKKTILGAKSDVTSLTLPPGSRFEVEFSTELKAYSHSFQLTEADPRSKGRWARFTADYHVLRSLLGNPKVLLKPLSATGNIPANQITNTEGLTGPLVINTPVKGDLTILADPGAPAPVPASADQAFKIINRTTDTGWRVFPDLDGSYPARGVLSVPNADGKKVDIHQVGVTKVPAGGTFAFWLTKGAGGTFAQRFTVKHSNRDAKSDPAFGEYTLEIKSVPGKAYPEDLDVKLTQTVGDKNKPWLYANRLVFDGYLELEDPDAELDFSLDEH